MNLPQMSVKRPVTTLMFMLIAILLGAVSMGLLPVDLYPSMDIPVGIVVVDYKGVAPEEIENLITKPIEQSVSTVTNLKKVSSYSKEGSSIVVVEYEYGTDMNFASLEMREKVDMIKGALPDGASNPLVIKIDPNAQAIVQIGISGNVGMAKLEKMVKDDILSRYERLEGVASVKTSGGNTKEVKIKVDPQKLSGYNMSLNNIQNILRSENLNLPGGRINKGDAELLVRTMGEFQTVDDIKNIPITLDSAEIIKLSDIASVNLGYVDKSSISRVDGKGSLSIAVTKQSVANTVKTAKRVLIETEKIRKEYPNLDIVIGSDQSKFINLAVNNVVRDGMFGGILAILIIFLFLRNIRSTLIISISIPISIISTFALMNLAGITINLISLLGLTLAVGLVVDDSIVVLENIYRFRERGYERVQGAVEGAREVSLAVFSSTMTTVAVFLPVVFVKGFTGMVFKHLAFTVVFSMLASFVASMTVVPMLASKILAVGEVKKRKHKGFTLGKFLDSFLIIIQKISAIYGKILAYVLNHRKSTVGIVIVIFIASIGLVGMVGGEFFPKQDEGSLVVEVQTPFGTTLEDSDKIVKKVENIVFKIKEKDKVFTSVGGSAEFTGFASNKSQVTVVLVDKNKRKKSTIEIVNEIREKVKNIIGAKITVSETSSTGGGGPQRSAIELEIRGDSMDILEKVSADFEREIKKVKGTTQVKSNVEEGDPEARVVVNRDIASQYGISVSEIGNAIKSSIDGEKSTTFKYDGDEINVVVSLDGEVKDSIENMKQIIINGKNGQSVSLGQIAEVEYANSPTQIVRINRTRTITVGSQLKNRDLQSVTKDIQKRLDNYQMPSGYSYRFTGQQEDMIDAFKGLILALVLSIIIVYMILASQFESLIHPFTIILSVPFSLTGAFIGLFITNKALSVPAFIGLIMLVGIVVKNAIILIDYILVLTRSGMPRNEAVIKAGLTRLRPILMTTMATTLGLLPLAIGVGDGAETNAPLAIVVIGGLILSTLVTLVFIPVVYTIFDDMKSKFKKKIKRKKGEVAYEKA